MNAPDDAYEVGYGRPPKETQWKKGQSGNAGAKKRGPAAVATVEIIDRLFVKPVEIVENGVARKVSTLEAILMRLWAAEKCPGANVRARFDCSFKSSSRRMVKNAKLLLKRP